MEKSWARTKRIRPFQPQETEISAQASRTVEIPDIKLHLGDLHLRLLACRRYVSYRRSHSDEVSAPDAARGFGHELELGPLLLLGYEIAFGGGSETALRADREVFDRNES